MVDVKETTLTRARYDRIAPLYDLMEALAERRYNDWRQRVWSLVTGPRVLEVGVGTGKNMPYYPSGIQVTGVDLSARMLDRARRRAERLGRSVTLLQMDAQALEFPDDAFDGAVATFVFCSVPDPVLGLQEMARVVRPGGRVVLLEHVRSEHPILGRLMDLLDPVIARLMGPHINRRTVDNVRRAGLDIERVDDLGARGIFKLIVARVSEENGKEEATDSQERRT
ncbi:MAG: methyltransferase domain-containing protein [Chloroflexi bacterium]|nr:methyltransferase domain-containing protein [Chloroflexota bacterium]